MNDLDSYLNRCYAMLLQQQDKTVDSDAELCACAKLVERDQ